MVYDKGIFQYQYIVVEEFVRHLAYYRGLKSVSDSQGIKSMFWGQTINAHFRVAVLNWCKVFGSKKSNDVHWKKTPIEDVERAKEQFAQKIYKHGINKKFLKGYRMEMIAFRDKVVAHHDLGEFPRIYGLDKALQIAYIYDDWVRDLLKPDCIEIVALRDRYERWRTVVESIGNLSIANNENGLGV